MTTDRFLGRKLGPYTLQGLLGKGGMGTVYRASGEAGEVVAVKVLPVDEESATSTMAARFKREIDACMNTRSQHVIQVYAAGTEEDCHWYSMELLEGKTLQELMKERGRLPREDVYRICRELAEALGHIHERGIIHRDLKPGNVMVVRSGRTVLMDFGLAKVADRTRITKTGHGLGTPRYMAPEMLLARPPTPATDLYQLGVILYELLTGQTVVKAKSFATLAHELTRVYPPEITRHDPSLGDDLNALVFNCIEKDQKRRYQSSEEFLADLEKIEAGEPVALRGDQKTLRLGAEREDIDHSDVTAVNPTPRATRPAPDSRPDSPPRTPRLGEGTPRASSSFSAIGADDSLMSLTHPSAIVETARRHPLHVLGAAAATLAILKLLSMLVAWRGDTRLREPIRIALSPRGAEAVYETFSEIPGAVRVFRLREDGSREEKTRVFRAADEAPGTRHRVALGPLTSGQPYAAEVLFPDQESRHPVEFTVPEGAAAEDVRLEWVTPERAELAFRVAFPVGGRIRQGPDLQASEEDGVPLPGRRREEWRVALPLADPFQPLEDLYLDLEGAAGWERSFGPYRFPGLDGQVLQSLSSVDIRGILLEMDTLRARSGVGSGLLLAIQERIQEEGLVDVLQRLRPHATKFFGRQDIPFERRRELFHGLQRLAPLDYLCLARNLPPLLGVDKVYREFVEVASTSRLEIRGSPLPGRREDAHAFSVREECLTPTGYTPDAYLRTIEGTARALGRLPQAVVRRTVELVLPGEVPPVVDLEVLVHNLYPEYYLEAEVNGALTVYFHSPDSERSLRRIEDLSPDPRALRTRRVAHLPPEVVQPGRNQVILKLHTVGPVMPFPTGVERVAVYYRRGTQ